MRNIICLVCLSLAATSVRADPVTEALAGKTLVAPGQNITTHADGTLTGKVGENLDIDLIGTWEIRDGQWCRTLSQPAAAAGSACQDITLGDGVVTIVGSRGPVEFAIQ
ncbi:MAG: hypothetical protein AAGC86_01475 [Pseudomonadota bacterium]